MLYTPTYEYFSDDYMFLYSPSTKSTVKKFKSERPPFFLYLSETGFGLKKAFHNLFVDNPPIFIFDSSSVKPYALDARAETIQTSESAKTSSLQEMSDEFLFDSMLTNDITIQMPPVKEYKIRLKIKKIEKAAPKFIDLSEV